MNYYSKINKLEKTKKLKIEVKKITKINTQKKDIES